MGRVCMTVLVCVYGSCVYDCACVCVRERERLVCGVQLNLVHNNYATTSDASNLRVLR